MMKGKVVIRVDGNREIGLGHVVRSLALAHMLIDSFEVLFVFKKIVHGILDEFLMDKISFVVIDSDDKIVDHVRRKDVVVFDGYNFSPACHRRLRELGCFVVCIDDIHSQHFAADIVINHAPGIKREVYSAESYTKFLLGVNYALLRPAFLKAASEKRHIEKIEDIIICFGGSDFKNLTIPVLKVVLGFSRFKRITVVIGKAYPYHTELSDTIRTIKSEKIRLLSGISETEMLEVLSSHDVAVVPSSGIVFEALAAKCIVVSGYYVDNQKELYSGFLQDKLIIGCDDFAPDKLQENLHSLIKNFHPVYDKPVFDGLSGQRIKNEFIKLVAPDIHFRLAKPQDCELYFEWANDDVVRRNARSVERIDWESHKTWFSKKISDQANSKLLTFFIDQIPIGQVRFDLNDNQWIIDYSIDKDFRNRGLGTRILKMAIEFHRNESNRKITAFVKKNNPNSMKVFQQLNFKVYKAENDYVYYLLD